MLGDLQYLSLSNESLIEKGKEKSPNQSNDKVMGQSSQMKPQANRGKRKKIHPIKVKKYGPNKIKWKPKNMKMGKVQEMDSNWGYSQAWEASKKILDEV